MIEEKLNDIYKELPPDVKLVAVSKLQPFESLCEAYRAGQRAFGESRPQELAQKVSLAEGMQCEWHFIGHLQTNKLKMVLPYVSLVQSVDSLRLLEAIDDWGGKNGKVTDVLLEMRIAAEDSKQGFAEEEILELMFRHDDFRHVRICGLMGMATNTDDADVVDADFARIEDFFLYLKDLFPEFEEFCELSIGMSGDWRLALRHSATMVRIGTSIFGDRM